MSTIPGRDDPEELREFYCPSGSFNFRHATWLDGRNGWYCVGCGERLWDGGQHFYRLVYLIKENPFV